MRTIINWNENWAFTKEACDVPAAFPAQWETVSLPHTWNAIDGQDGGNDYHRGTCWYAKELQRSLIPEGARCYLELKGANSSADVYVNGQKLAHHDGGYSTWRVGLPEGTEDSVLIAVAVDNSPNETVYPQMADFTFYGGLYRDVNLIMVSETHFDLDYYGAPGIKVTPTVQGADASVEIETYLTNAKEGQTLTYLIRDGEGNEVARAQGGISQTAMTLELSDVRLWNGRKDPYLYTAEAQISENGQVLDNVSARFGCRTFRIDAEKGFFLNGESYPLHGVSRHQDWKGLGNALKPEHHEKDIDLICEVGATTIRLAHYQHDQYFYDLCDERGLVIWAEIPYISKHMPGGRENTLSQMRELIAQNYNHPSIVVWGLSNEISMAGSNDDLLENHRLLNDLAHEMDKTRLTTIACVSMCDIHDPYVHIPDVVSYNHYYGWYGGDTSMNGPWMDNFHKEYPELPIGMSEYGCEALNWHTSQPDQGDYTEEYQAYYHEELIKQLFTRPYIWATHVWNMFDFGADARNEGGENGQNHKGLVTFDRQYKKDSFYAYKAWLSDEPFVHICGKRYVDRVEETTKVTVYSNQPQVELFVNGQSLGVQESEEHFFYFQVPNKGESVLAAAAGDCRDESRIRKVEKFNEDYRLKEKGAILNWFDVTAPEGYFSLNDKLSAILACPEGKALFQGMMAQMMASQSDGKGGMADMASAMAEGGGMMQMLGGFTVLRMTSLLGTTGIKVTKEQLLALNAQLNKIKKS